MGQDVFGHDKAGGGGGGQAQNQGGGQFQAGGGGGANEPKPNQAGGVAGNLIFRLRLVHHINILFYRNC